MNYEVRKIIKDDFKLFNAFCFEMYKDRHEKYPLLFKLPPARVYTEKQFIAEINSSEVINLLAIQNKEIVGFIQADIYVERETRCIKGYKYADIRNLFVLAESETKKVYAILYKELEQEARERRLDKLGIINFGELKENNFYIKQGFKPLSVNYFMNL